MTSGAEDSAFSMVSSSAIRSSIADYNQTVEPWIAPTSSADKKSLRQSPTHISPWIQASAMPINSSRRRHADSLIGMVEWGETYAILQALMMGTSR
jgi:hypothetical protein